MAHKQVKTHSVTPNMVLATDVYTYSHQLVMPEGTVLNEFLIDKLKKYAIDSVYIRDEKDIPVSTEPAPDIQDFNTPLPTKNISRIQMTDIPISNRPKLRAVPGAEMLYIGGTATPDFDAPPVIDFNAYTERIQSTEEYMNFSSAYDNTLSLCKDEINAAIVMNSQLNLEALVSSITDAINCTSSPSKIIDMLQCMKMFDNETYIHATNVAMLSYLIGSWCRLSDSELLLLIQCGLLHDVGKLMIPKSILSKPAALSDEERTEIKHHPEYGYNILKKKGLSAHVCNAAYMHHERIDGSGYPQGLHHDEIDIFAQIVSIADVYDAMTSVRCYRAPMCALEVIAAFEDSGYTQYNAIILRPFLEGLANTYMNTLVKLNTGEVGKIIFINKDKFSAPVVSVKSTNYDLSQEKNIYIVEIL